MHNQRGTAERVSGMSPLDREALNQFGTNFVENITRVTHALRRNCIISQETLDNILELEKIRTPRAEINRYLINELADNCTLDELIQTFLVTYFKELARKLFVCKMQCQNRAVVTRVYRSNTSNRAKIGKYFKDMKQMVQENAFQNPCAHIKQISDRKKQLIRKTKVDKDKMRLCDEYVVLKAVEMDARTNTTSKVSKDHPGYLEIEKYVTSTSNTALTRVILYSRQAIAYSTTNQFEEAENMIKNAKISADVSGSCAEVTDMLYKSVVIKLSILEKDPNNEELLESILHDCYRGLWTLEEEAEDVRSFWTKAFLLRMAFAHLGIGKSCRMIITFVPKKRYLFEAERLLQYEILRNLESRRQMLISVAKARLNEFKQNIDLASEYLSEAIRLCIEGNYAARESLEDYQQFLLNLKPYPESKHKMDNDVVGVFKNPISQIQQSQNTDLVKEICTDQEFDFQLMSSIKSDSFPSLEHLHLSSLENEENV